MKLKYILFGISLIIVASVLAYIDLPEKIDGIITIEIANNTFLVLFFGFLFMLSILLVLFLYLCGIIGIIIGVKEKWIRNSFLGGY